MFWYIYIMCIIIYTKQTSPGHIILAEGPLQGAVLSKSYFFQELLKALGEQQKENLLGDQTAP